jgi:hypothetical protein
MGVKPCVFRYNGLYHTSDEREMIGVIANELQEIIPEAIFTVKGKLRPTDAEETDILHYDLTPAVMANVNATKELVAIFDQLKARIARLEKV